MLYAHTDTSTHTKEDNFACECTILFLTTLICSPLITTTYTHTNDLNHEEYMYKFFFFINSSLLCLNLFEFLLSSCFGTRRNTHKGI